LRGLRSHRRHRRQTEDHGGWGIAPMAAFGFGLLVHWTTLEEQLAELRRHAFDVREILAAPDGRRLAAKDDTSDVEWFQVLATRGDGVPLHNA
jgi:hypothetical protein